MKKKRNARKEREKNRNALVFVKRANNTPTEIVNHSVISFARVLSGKIETTPTTSNPRLRLAKISFTATRVTHTERSMQNMHTPCTQGSCIGNYEHCHCIADTHSY